MRLMMLDDNSWSQEKQISLFVVSSGDIGSLPKPLNEFRCAHLLMKYVDKKEH